MSNQLTSTNLTVGSGSITGIVGSGILSKGASYIAVQTTGNYNQTTTLPALNVGEVRAYRSLTGSGTDNDYTQGFRLPSSGTYRYELEERAVSALGNSNFLYPTYINMGAGFGTGVSGGTVIRDRLTNNHKGYTVAYQRIS